MIKRLVLFLFAITICVCVSAGAQVTTGLEVLIRDGCKPLQGKRVGLITNHSAVNRKGEHIVDLLHKQPGVNIVALFAPEHGIRGDKDAIIRDGKDEKTGLPVHSLYGTRYRPTEESLKGIDVLVFDIQDVGARFYTYPATMKICMFEAARHKIPFIVLDRPNPINGCDMDGPVLDAKYTGFTAWGLVPTRHGMTMGELARYFNDQYKFNCDLTVIKMEGWRRNMWFDQTGIPWTNPSPNLRNVNQETLYPAVGVLESTNLSVGRGTDMPFEQLGAPWLNSEAVVRDLNSRNLPGIRFEVSTFTPAFRELKGQKCNGVRAIITDRNALRPTETAVHIADAIYRVHGEKFILKGTRGMFGKAEVPEAIQQKIPPAEIIAKWKQELASFAESRKKYLLYD